MYQIGYQLSGYDWVVANSRRMWSNKLKQFPNPDPHHVELQIHDLGCLIDNMHLQLF